MSEASTGDVDERTVDFTQQDRLIRALELFAQRDAAPAGKRRRDWDALAAVIASFIGLLALAVSAYTAYVQRAQLRAQVWPHLELQYTSVQPGVAHLVTNQGTGPARVVAMRVMVGGALVTTWSDVKKVAGYAGGEGITTSWISHAVIPAGKEIAFVRPRDDDQSRAKFEELLPGGKHELAVTLCYCSVLEECWTTGANLPSSESPVPGPPDSCPIPEGERFKQ